MCTSMYTHTCVQKHNPTQHTAIFCSTALRKMSGNKKQKHPVVSLNPFQKSLAKKQKGSNANNDERLLQRMLSCCFFNIKDIWSLYGRVLVRHISITQRNSPKDRLVWKNDAICAKTVRAHFIQSWWMSRGETNGPMSGNLASHGNPKVTPTGHSTTQK